MTEGAIYDRAIAMGLKLREAGLKGERLVLYGRLACCSTEQALTIIGEYAALLPEVKA